MKIFYAVQGTGNGHITRARAMQKALAVYPDIEVTWLFSGRHKDCFFDMECFGNYRTFNGLTFVTAKGKVSQWQTLKQAKPLTLLRDINQFDVSGYDVLLNDFEPITGRIHLPPPIHQTFETNAFVICSFVPRMYDYHPLSIPAPYNHSNIDADEVLYYVDGDFMSRNDVEAGHISLHPAGIPHGPHPGAAERSIGKTKTEELAVMVDTFKPLEVTEEAIKIADEEYYKSWLEGPS